MKNNLRPLSFGIACGTALGITACAVAAIGIAAGQESTLVKFFVSMMGFELSPQGAFIALATGLVYGFIGGSMIAYLYNFTSSFQE